MWKLKHVKKEHLEHFLFVGEELVVGRKDASLLIPNDPSLSRRHAVLWVNHPEQDLGDPSKKSTLFLRDEKSKYGTFLNGVRVAAETELSEGDVIKFGQFESEYRVHVHPLVVTTSCVDLSAKRELKKTVHMLGGSFISEWQPSCSHLVMPEVKVTIKALCCLVSAKPIVTPEYFQDLKNSLRNSSSLVPPKQYVPPIGEALIDKDQVSFDVNLQRKTLFENKTFFFLDEKQFKKLHLGIMLGSGQASILSSDSVDLERLVQEGSCVIDPNKELTCSQGMKNLLPKVSSILQKNKLRLIPESDIGLSVAYCSTEKFCNPSFTSNETLRSQRIQSQTLSQREVYVPDTEQQAVRNESKPKISDATIFGSLNLTSFNQGPAEDMEVSDIPLSAQVKRELDDIFGDDMEIREDLSKDPSPQRPIKHQKRSSVQQNREPPVPRDPSPQRSIKTQKRSPRVQQNGEPPVQEVHSPGELENGRRKVKSEVLTPSPAKRPHSNGIGSAATSNGTNHFGFGSNGAVQPEPELPRNLVKIEYVSLICRKSAPVVTVYKNSSVKNFKKFRKVHPVKAKALPRIIGAHELVAHDKLATTINNELWEDPEEEALPRPVRGEFDWDTPAV